MGRDGGQRAHTITGDDAIGGKAVVLGAIACLYLFWQAFAEHWRLMLGWTAIGMAIYFLYGYRHSKQHKQV